MDKHKDIQELYDDFELPELIYDDMKVESKFKYDYVADWIDIDSVDDEDIKALRENEEKNESNEKKTTSKSSSKTTSSTTKKKSTVINSMHKGHRERVRNKFLQHGLDSFTKYEVLELLLFYAIPYKDTNEIAHKLIDKFGSVKAVINADTKDLMDIEGISEVSASLITLHRELYKYIHTNEFEYETLSTSTKSGKFCCEYFMSHVNETSIIICLDLNNVIKNIEIISEGCENETAIYLRKAVKIILQNKCSKVIVAHNHPGEHPEPSPEDVVTTNRLSEFLDGVGVFLMDHIVCAGNQFVSMSDRGLIVNKKVK